MLGLLLMERGNQVHHTLLDKRWPSSPLDIQSFRVAVCDADHYLVVGTVREKLSVSKRATRKSDLERFNL
jgi:hypothetical protein